MIIEFTTLHDNVTLPKRANPSDAGLDIYFSPQNMENVRIRPGESVVLETGLKFGIPHGYMLEVKNRSSIASKLSLVVGACVIDSGYEGEVKVNLHNIGTQEQIIYPGDKIAQIVMIPVVHFRMSHSRDTLYNDPITISARGDGGFGSTGK